MSQHSQAVIDAILREDLFAFLQKCFETIHPGERMIPAWHVDAMVYQLTRTHRGDIKRLLINVPPRYLKSETASVAFSAWLMGHDPSLKIIVASYGSDLAARCARDFRRVVEARWYQRLFPEMQLASPNREMEQTTTAGGSRRAIGAGGSITGFGADYIICDDISKAADVLSDVHRQSIRDFYEQTLYSRLNDKRHGRIIVLQQRLHEDDFPSYLLEKGNFECLVLPAIADQDRTYALTGGRLHTHRRGEALFPEREPLETLEEMRIEMGAYAFSAQYLQQPVPLVSQFVRWDWFQRYDEAPSREELLGVVQSWDTASSIEKRADWSVCTTWGLRRDGKWLLLDLLRGKWVYPDLKNCTRAYQHQWQADRVLIEDAGVGIGLLAEFRREQSFSVRPVKPDQDKVTRLITQTAKIKEERILIPAQAPWLDTFRHEITAFPSGRHDDQVDSMTQFLDAHVGTRWESAMLNPHSRPRGERRPRGVDYSQAVRGGGRRTTSTGADLLRSVAL